MENVSLLAAFGAGLISFLSPCVLPLVPGYLSIISGVSLDQLRADDAPLRKAVVINSSMFIVGFSITFIVMGASATVIGQIILSQLQVLYRIAGIVIIIFGLHLIGVFRIGFLYQDKRFHGSATPRGSLGALVLGLAFAFGWSPCIGPILGSILMMAAQEDTVGGGVFLLGIYSLGLAVPFMLTSLGLNRFLSFYGRFKHHFRTVEIISGVLVITIGILILTNNLARLAALFTPLNRFAL